MTHVPVGERDPKPTRMTATQTFVVGELTAANGRPVSGHDLAAKCGVTRAAVAKAVEGLRERGYDIASSPRRGHQLVRRTGLLLPFEIHDGLRTAHLGRNVYHYATVPSTQTIAAHLAEQGAPHGTLVVAETQESGRGRLARPFFCPPGGVWCTVILRGEMPLSRAPLAGLAAGVAASRAIYACTGLATLLKWPNDVLVGGHKVVGILTEMSSEEQGIHYILVGAGFNAGFEKDRFPPDLRDRATTLATELGAPVDRRSLLQAYLLELEGLFGALVDRRAEHIVDAWKALPNTVGRRVRVESWDEVVEGRALDVAADGSLLVETDDQTLHRFNVGDVLHVPGLVEREDNDDQ